LLLSRRMILHGLSAAPIVTPAIVRDSDTPFSIWKQRWIEDIDHLYAGLRSQHRNLFHHTPERTFLHEKAQLIKTVDLFDHWRMITSIHAFVAQAGDGHTFLFSDAIYRKYPLEYFLFGDGLYVTKTSASGRRLLGRKVIAIDRVPLKAVQARLSRFIPQAENRWHVAGQQAKLLRYAELLFAAGVSKNRDQMTLLTRGADGNEEEAVIAIEQPGDLTLIGGPEPLAAGGQLDWVIIQDSKALYVNFSNYKDLAERSADLIAFINASDVAKVIIDMRQNRGGNYTLPRKNLIEPLQFMSKINRRGNLFVLIGRHTFSAAMTNALDFWRETEAVLIGEPTGARPNGYQELRQFELPNSRLRIGCSTNSYRFDPAGRDAVYPDLMVTSEAESFFAGHDRELQAALHYSMD
jgi:hypothetical protein